VRTKLVFYRFLIEVCDVRFERGGPCDLGLLEVDLVLLEFALLLITLIPSVDSETYDEEHRCYAC
jgi:hypothetical protein